MEKGIYKTTDGQIRNVVDFDELNEMVYVHIEGSQHKWYPKSEYSTWKKEGEEEHHEDTGEMVLDYAGEHPPEITEEKQEEIEVPKKKKAATKKKTK